MGTTGPGERILDSVNTPYDDERDLNGEYDEVVRYACIISSVDVNLSAFD